MKPKTFVSQVREALDASGVHVDTIGKNKRGEIVVRRGYFYSHGYDDDKLRAAVTDALAKAGLLHGDIESGNHWAAFRGGASTANQSHWWVTIAPKPGVRQLTGQGAPMTTKPITYRSVNRPLWIGFQSALGQEFDCQPSAYRSQDRKDWVFTTVSPVPDDKLRSLELEEVVT